MKPFKPFAFFAGLAALLFASSFSFAGECNTKMLETLVTKGMLSADEALEVKKLSAAIDAPVSTPYNDNTISIYARFQMQYAYLTTNGDSDTFATSKNTFMMRRVIFGLATDPSKSYGAKLSFDFIFDNKVSISYLYKNIDTDYIKGRLRFGYLKPDFGMEEVTSSFNLYAIERSIATNYWCGPRNARKLGQGSFMTGLFWYGDVRQVKGLHYFCAVTNSENYKLGGESSLLKEHNSPDVFGGVSYDFAPFDSAKITLGANVMYGNDADKTAIDNTAAIFGVNPYLRFDYKGVRVLTEFLMSHSDCGRKMNSSYGVETPMGMNFCVEKKFAAGAFGKIAPVFRFTYLDTNGRGVSPSDGLRKAGLGTAFDRARGFYFGANWYVSGDNSLKVSAGYEYSQFMGSNSGQDAYANTFRMQIQTRF